MDPLILTSGEWLEIINQPQVRAAWGIQDGERPSDFARFVCAAKFKFHSGGPGYVGALHTLR
jgi:hypothetical protein